MCDLTSLQVLEVGFFLTQHSADGNCIRDLVEKRDPGSKMVYYFTSNVVTPSAFIFVGKDKVESK